MHESWHSRLAQAEKLDRHFTVELEDAAGEVHAIIEKTVNVRKARTQECKEAQGAEGT